MATPLRTIEFTLVADGSSDAVLIEPLTWLLREFGCEAANGTWADLRLLREHIPGIARRLI
jgi:hypothetical protein